MTNFESVFRGNGIAITTSRLAIFEVLENAKEHLSIEEILSHSKKIDKKIGLATVYRTLNLLCDLKLVEKSEFPNLSPVFEKIGLDDEHHHHIIDIKNNKIEEFFSKELDALLEKIAQKKGYKMLDHKIEIYGQKIK